MCFSRLWNELTSLLFNCSLLTKHATRLKEMSAMLGKWVSYHTSQGKLDLHCLCSFCWGNLYPLFRVEAVIGSSCLPMFWLNHLNVIKIKKRKKKKSGRICMISSWWMQSSKKASQVSTGSGVSHALLFLCVWYFLLHVVVDFAHFVCRFATLATRMEQYIQGQSRELVDQAYTKFVSVFFYFLW